MKAFFRFLLFLLTLIQFGFASPINLIKAEEEFIKNNPLIKVHCVLDASPFTFIQDDKCQGYSIDHIKLVASKVGLDIDIVTGFTWDQYIDQLKNNQLDVMLNIVQTKNREKYFSFTSTYLTIMNTVFVKKGFHPETLNDLNGKTISIVKGFSEVKLLQKFYPKINLHYVENETEAFKILSLGKVDATIHNIGVGNEILLKNGLINVNPEFEIKDKEFQVNLRLAVNKEKKILRDILEKGLGALTTKEKIHLRDKWLFTQLHDSKKKLSNLNNKAIISLTEEEQAFIKSSSVIKVHNESDWPPYNYSENGLALGFSIDIMNLIAQRTGIKIEYITGPTWNEFLSMMKNKELDIMLNIVKTPSREEYLLFTPPYADNPNSILSKQGKVYKTIESLFGKTVALPKGFFTEEILRKNYPQIKLYTVKNALESMKAVSFNQADAAVGELAIFNYLSNKHMMTNLIVSGEAMMGNPEFSLLNIATRKDLPILHSILIKGLNSLSAEEKKIIQQKWLTNSTFEDLNIKLTNEEKNYLLKKQNIKMCVNPDIPPFEEIDKNGNHKGISADIIQIVSEKLNKPLALVRTKSWKETVDKFKNKKCDIIPMAVKTQNREKFMNFSKPYIEEAIVAATKEDKFFIKDSSDFQNKKIGVVEGYAFIELLKKKNPSIKIVHVKDTKDGLEKVQDEELFAYVDALPVIAYTIQKNGMLDLKIAGKLEFDVKLNIASRQDEPLLGSIIQKALDDIDEEEIRNIVGKWISIKLEQSFDYRKLIYISLFFLVVIGLMIQRNRTIEKMNQKLEELSVTDNLTKLYNRNKLDEILMTESNRANRFLSSFGIIMIDIDFFKSVNDTQGHQMGDTVLKEFANILKCHTRKIDTVGRWGGEEFMIICPKSDLEGTITLANSLKDKISSYPFSSGTQKTASFGVTIYQKDEAIHTVIKRADDALYNAKENGRNRVEFKK